MTLHLPPHWHKFKHLNLLFVSYFQDECHNFIKVLVPRNDDLVFICGTNGFNPMCRYYRVSIQCQDPLSKLAHWNMHKGTHTTRIGRNFRSNLNFFWLNWLSMLVCFPCISWQILMCGWLLCSLQLDNLELDGEEINGLARCPFDSKQTNVALFAGRGQAHRRPLT